MMEFGKEKMKNEGEKQQGGSKGAEWDGNKVDGWEEGAGEEVAQGDKLVFAVATGDGFSPWCRVNKRDKEDPSVGSTRKPAQKMAKGGGKMDQGDGGDRLEDVMMQMGEGREARLEGE
jgi:hypothetical protein